MLWVDSGKLGTLKSQSTSCASLEVRIKNICVVLSTMCILGHCKIKVSIRSAEVVGPFPKPYASRSYVHQSALFIRSAKLLQLVAVMLIS
jgi:hypothetical protein